MYIITLIVTIIIIYVLTKIVKRKNGKKNFPEPPASRIFGHILHLKSTKESLKNLSKFIKDYGKTIQLRLGPSFPISLKAVVTIDCKLAEFVLSSNRILTKSINYQWIKAWLKNGLLTSDGPYWRRHRKILQPNFHFDILKDFIIVFESAGNKLVENLEKYDKTNSVDIHPLAALCALDIICETAMGIKINAQDGENSDYVENVEEEGRILMDRFFNPLKAFDLTFWLTRDYYIQKKALKILHNFTSKVINSRKADNYRKNGEKLSFLDLILKFVKEGVKMSDEEVQEEVDTVMFGGYDTTATAISFTLFCLANHPEIQVLQEQKNLFGNEKNPEITLKELHNIKYLENVIKESLRLYPPAPILGRYTHEDIEFEGHSIPKGTNIGIFVFGIHRNEEYFPEPEKFNPDRFDNVIPRPYTYLPFSSGPRNCIGQKYAMLELKSVISKIIRHFEVRTAIPIHELQLAAEITLTSTNGIKIGLVKRD